MIGGSSLRAVGLVFAAALFGVVLGVALFGLTSDHPRYTYFGPVGLIEDQQPGFDPWTGEPHGRRTLAHVTFSGGAQPTWVESDVPADLVGRRAIPLPVGWALGCLAVLAVVAWRRRGSADATSR